MLRKSVNVVREKRDNGLMRRAWFGTKGDKAEKATRDRCEQYNEPPGTRRLERMLNVRNSVTSASERGEDSYTRVQQCYDHYGEESCVEREYRER